ncbi:hypothetical protein J1N35_027067 [Gossypium stocksii]|uniref:Clp ATPase C-terminal domain-containing protein n=1 Tax=Gossypium stocksii TaxID=47602 RepID=A0A9D3V9L9_9ROSI|nr:hypothetical protein J1N35_027067 [Gossypium stocksii]
MLQEVIDRLKGKEIKLQVTERFRERVVEEGYDPSYGARPLRRAMRLLEDSMAEKMLAGEIKEGDSVTVDIDSDGNIMGAKQTKDGRAEEEIAGIGSELEDLKDGAVKAVE